ncbi:MAG: hypothetical protein ACI4EU_06160 [Butyrivibrio sp.]
MGIVSLLTALAGLATTLCHYASHSKIMGAVTTALLIVSIITGLVDIKKKNKNGGVDYNKVQPGVIGHAMAFTILLLGGIMCAMAIAGKYPANIVSIE